MTDGNALSPISKAEQALAQAKTPQESRAVEAMAAAARAWAKEQDDYELIIDAFRVYFLARCHTTELVEPTIRKGQYGREGNNDVTFSLLSDHNWSKMDYSRRKREVALRRLLDAYVDECITNYEYPSFKGIIQFATMGYSGKKVDAMPQLDIAEQLREKWGTEPGQVWLLGNHRLVCGDSQDPGTLWLALDGQLPDMILTDPPYGISLDTDYSKMPSTKPEGNKAYSPIANDDKPFDYQAVNLRCEEEFWFGADYYCKTLPDGGSWLVWDKRADEQFDAMIGSAFELIWSKSKHKREIIRYNNTLFSGNAEAKDKLHPTVKPVEVIGWILGRHSKSGELVIDLYAGTGTTIIACENRDCRCIAIEIDPRYVAVTLERWLAATGNTPVLEGNS